MAFTIMRWFTVALACAFQHTLFCNAETTEPPSRFEVLSLPGYADEQGDPLPLPSPMYTGYINAGVPPSGKGTMYFHYMMVQAEQNPESAPVIVWYNGGPGASSLFGLFQEFGPLLLTEQSLDQQYIKTGVPTPILNPNRWSKTHTLVAIDSPPPMGLSFCSEEGLTGAAGGPRSCGPWTDKTVFHANHLAHKEFFTNIFPGLKSNPVFFAGESYGGMYVPGFVGELMADPIEGLRFQGLIVGDGFPGCPELKGKPADWCIDLTNVGVFKYPNANPGPWYDVQFFHGHQQFSTELYNEIMAKCPEPMLRGSKGEQLSPVCFNLIDRMAEEVGPFSAYNLYDNCPEDNPWTPPTSKANSYGMSQSLRTRRSVVRRLKANTSSLEEQLQQAKSEIKTLKDKIRQGGESGTSSPCLGNAMPEWFAQKSCLKAIGAPDGNQFINLDNGIGFDYTSDQTFVGPIYEEVLKKGWRVLIHEGDTDACGLTTSPIEDWAYPLFNGALNQTRAWRPFASGRDSSQYMGGYITEWGEAEKPQAQFVSIRGAGHMVPLNRPRVASLMVHAFTHKEVLPAYKPSQPSTPNSVYV